VKFTARDPTPPVQSELTGPSGTETLGPASFPDRTNLPQFADIAPPPRGEPFSERTAPPQFSERTSPPQFSERTQVPQFPERTQVPQFPDRTQPPRAVPPRFPDQPAVSPNQPAVSPNQPAVSPNQPAVSPNQPAVSPNQPAVSPKPDAPPQTSGALPQANAAPPQTSGALPQVGGTGLAEDFFPPPADDAPPALDPMHLLESVEVDDTPELEGFEFTRVDSLSAPPRHSRAPTAKPKAAVPTVGACGRCEAPIYSIKAVFCETCGAKLPRVTKKATEQFRVLCRECGHAKTPAGSTFCENCGLKLR